MVQDSIHFTRVIKLSLVIPRQRISVSIKTDEFIMIIILRFFLGDIINQRSYSPNLGKRLKHIVLDK